MIGSVDEGRVLIDLNPSVEKGGNTNNDRMDDNK